MRIRTIKPEFFLHDRLFDAEKESALPLRLAFIGLWCAADREGRFSWEPRRLGATILPYDGLDFSRVLDALVTRGFVERYASESREFGVIPSFTRHQVINNRESPSILPDPERCDRMALPTRAPRVDDACPTPLMHAQGEGKGREGKGKGTNSSSTRRQNVPKTFVPPTLAAVLSFCSEKFPDWHRSRVEGAFRYYEISEWRTAKGESVLNWKTKFLNLYQAAKEKGCTGPTKEFIDSQHHQQGVDHFNERLALLAEAERMNGH